jgi:hypothetical protein
VIKLPRGVYNYPHKLEKLIHESKIQNGILVITDCSLEEQRFMANGASDYFHCLCQSISNISNRGIMQESKLLLILVNDLSKIQSGEEKPVHQPLQFASWLPDFD